ncbi:MarR family transcriptional regulator [Anaerocolumna sedimenticola]|uniref:MarR family transcriptional regulator n=1 Tax=Anaerocolumna sedimenticola TaxID=2696063 RepID=A0A6P1TP36_9FIRM|nr:MarR family transcriptional regulator [Anaerocolumna sedimenticola]QHQ61641.1 MarR family transcriptional regulator [Anaerocolumna sedimenticola]
MNQGKLLTKRIAHISKYTQFHMDEVLKPYNLSSGTYPFLLALWQNEGINLEKISREIKVDKALSTRNIQKLIELGYLEKLSDQKDCRACRLFLTDKAKEVIPIIKDEIHLWISDITQDLSREEIDLLDTMLEKILTRAKVKKI